MDTCTDIVVYKCLTFMDSALISPRSFFGSSYAVEMCVIWLNCYQCFSYLRFGAREILRFLFLINTLQFFL